MLRVKPDMAIKAERFGEFLPEVSATALAGDPANHFADQPSVGQRVIAVFGARLPPGILLRERAGHRLPIKQRLRGERLADGGQAGAMA